MAGVSVDRIVDLNGLDSPDVIFAGDSLLLAEPASPPPSASPTPNTAPTPVPTAAATATAVPPPPTPTAQTTGNGVHVVQPGDTLYSIARRYGVTPATLQSLNKLASPDHIFVGQRLVVPRTSATPAITSTPGVATNDVVALARQSLGKPYLFGGTTPAGFDCSGFIYYVFTRAGRTMPRDIWSQYEAGSHVTREQLQAGDLVFFQDTYMEGLSHNGIYVGNGEFINAVNEDSGVAMSKLSSPYWAERWYGGTRPGR